MKKKITLKPRPKVGKFYHFWDDGKTGPSRHYICKCEEIITPSQAQTIVFDENIYNDWPTTLYDIWRIEIDDHRQGDNFKVLNGASIETGEPWLYAEETDCFVRLSCPNYDENDLWAVRTVNGDWFTIDIQSGWQGGTLDVTGEIYDNIISYYEQNGYDTSSYTNVKYERKEKK